MTDEQLKSILRAGEMPEVFYEGEFSEGNMKIFHKIAEAFKDWYDLQAYNEKFCAGTCENCICGGKE